MIRYQHSVELASPSNRPSLGLIERPIMRGDSLGPQMRMPSDLQIFSGQGATIGQVRAVGTSHRTPRMLPSVRGNEGG